MFTDINKQGGATRRLPVYLLLDTSGSMAGDKINGVNQGLQIMGEALLDNPQAVDTAHICVITFSSSPQVVVPFTDTMTFRPPTLIAGGVTRLDLALDELNRSIEKDVKENTNTQKGDYKPLIWVFTDGMPTDANGNLSNSWQQSLQRLRNRTTKKIGTIIVLGVGSDNEIDEAMLKGLGDVVLRMKEATNDRIQSYFEWLSDSIGLVSQNIAQSQGQGQAQAPIQLPPIQPESGIQVII